MSENTYSREITFFSRIHTIGMNIISEVHVYFKSTGIVVRSWKCPKPYYNMLFLRFWFIDEKRDLIPKNHIMYKIYA